MKLTLAILLFAALVLLIFGVPLAASLILDSSGQAAVGIVTGKVERIRENHMRAARELEVTVQYRPAEAQKDESSSIILNEDAYDRITVGARIPLRYQPVGLLRRLEPWAPGTRLSGQNTPDWLAAVVPADTVRVSLSIAGLIPLCVLWLKKGKKYFGLLLIYLALLGVYWLTPMSEPAPAGETRTTTAKVRAIHRIERILTSEYQSTTRSLALMRPMELVELEFVPEGRTEPVVAADKITAGSLPGLKEDEDVRITYQVSRPRIARMDGCSRNYGWTNLATVAMPWVIAMFFIYGGTVLIAALAAVTGRMHRRRGKMP